jgi:hypothetical protein
MRNPQLRVEHELSPEYLGYGLTVEYISNPQALSEVTFAPVNETFAPSE